MLDDMPVCALDHIVLNVANVERSLRFYQTTLGLAAERVEAWRRHEVGFPNVRVSPSTLIGLITQMPRADAGGCSYRGYTNGGTHRARAPASSPPDGYGLERRHARTGGQRGSRANDPSWRACAVRGRRAAGRLDRDPGLEPGRGAGPACVATQRSDRRWCSHRRRPGARSA